MARSVTDLPCSVIGLADNVRVTVAKVDDGLTSPGEVFNRVCGIAVFPYEHRKTDYDWPPLEPNQTYSKARRG